MEFYRHSGAVTISGLSMALEGGAATAVVLGIIYSYAIALPK